MKFVRFLFLRFDTGVQRCIYFQLYFFYFKACEKIVNKRAQHLNEFEYEIKNFS